MSHEHHHDKCCANEHEHHHEHHHDGLIHQLSLIFASASLLVLAVVIEHKFQLPTWQLLLVYLVPYLVIGHDTLKEAAEGIAHGHAFDEHFLMSVATIGALCIGFLPGAENQFPEAVFVMLFFQVGELFEGYAEGKSRESISHLMDIRPDYANVACGDAQLQKVSPDQVEVGSVIVIRPGEKVPLDGVVIEGTSSLNTVALTGESMPREITVDDEIISGCINLSGVIRVRTTKNFGESTVSKIIELVENASEHKSQSEAFITRFARIYTPIVVCAAIAIAILPPLFIAVANSSLSTFHSSFLLPLRIGYQCTAHLLRGHRRCFAPWHTREGSQLYGYPCQDKDRRLRQDRNAHPWTICRRGSSSRHLFRTPIAPPGSPCRTFLHPPHRGRPARCLPRRSHRRLSHIRHRRNSWTWHRGQC